MAKSKSDKPDKRRREIVDLVSNRGFVPIEDLARYFEVTVQTIRSDVNQLCREGLLHRYHGGVGLVSTLDNATFAKRRVLRHQQKVRIAAAVAQRVPNDSSVFLHYGTTMEAVAAALQEHRGLLVLTNNISAVSQFRPNGGSEIVLLGGQVRASERCTQGAMTVAAIQQFQVDVALLSVGCIDGEGVLYEFSHEVAETARAALRNANQVFLAVDHQKFGRKGLVRVGSLREVSALFTDRPVPDAIARLAAASGVSVQVV